MNRNKCKASLCDVVSTRQCERKTLKIIEPCEEKYNIVNTLQLLHRISFFFKLKLEIVKIKKDLQGFAWKM